MIFSSRPFFSLSVVFPIATPDTISTSFTPSYPVNHIRPLDIPELRLNTFQHLPQSDLVSASQVSHVWYSTAHELIDTRLNLRRKDRATVWSHMNQSSRGLTILSRRYTSATIDLNLNPGEILSALLLLSQSDVKAVQFISSERARPEWGLQFGTDVLYTLISHLPNADHFMMFNISTRFQWTLMEAGQNQITTLELHSSPFLSRLYTVPRVRLARLHSLHLVEHLAHEVEPFLTRVVLCIEAPNLQTLSIANCLLENPTPVREAVRQFSNQLTTLALLNNQPPESDILFAQNSLPPLPYLVHLEVEASWSHLYVGATAETAPLLHSLALHALPEHILGNLRVVNWPALRLAWAHVPDSVRTLEWCCRAGEQLPPGTLLEIVNDNLRAANFILSETIQLCVGVRDPLPIAPAYDSDGDVMAAWGTHD
ncbi:hypothetical protein AAF712_005542 [Marasmius tenuissimus]|uniref:F-box domain-containing protein n=1 Tax=Marasmius tenuissimus TaxID=585030 RepID=A0ABR3A0D3_9AGAR